MNEQDSLVLIRKIIKEELDEVRAVTLAQAKEPEYMIGQKLAEPSIIRSMYAPAGLFRADQQISFHDQIESLLRDTVPSMILDIARKVKEGS